MVNGVRLSDIDVFVGVIVEATDPENLARVKCVIPGIFDTSTMKPEALPWVWRLPMCGQQHYSNLLTGEKVWVLRHITNKFEFWYIPFPEYKDNTKEVIKSTEADVLISRYASDASAMLYYNKEDGFKTVLGENYIQLDPDGNIINMSNGYSSKINGKHYFCGQDEGSYEPMVLGDKLTELFKQLSADLDELATAANNPYDSALQAPIRKMKLHLDKNYPEIKSLDCSLT